MSKLSETVSDFLIPSKMRAYWTFRTATAVAVVATLVSALIRVFVRFPPERIAAWQSRDLLYSPLFLSLYYLFVVIVLSLVYVTKHRTNWYRWRVWVYCMVFTGALIGLLNLVLPLRASQ